MTESLPDPDGSANGTDHPTTSYTYDNVGHVLTRTDPDGNTTTYAYDHLDRLVSDTNELGKSRLYTYDSAGNVKSITDRNGRVRQFNYDELNRVTEEQWLSGAIGSSVIRTVSYSYDARGRLLTASDPDSSYAYGYDGLGRVLTIDNDGTSGVSHVVLANGYDANSRRTSVAATVDGTADFSNGYSYDALGRMTQVTQTGVVGGANVADKRVDFSYNAAGFFDQIGRYSDLTGTALVANSGFGYDDLNRLTSLTHTDSSSTEIAGYTWAYDVASRLISASDPDGTTSYSYDNNAQLTAADHSSQNDESYTYDDNGNRTGSGHTTTDDNRLTSDGTYNYQYDDEGNLTKRTTISSGAVVEYAWDYRDRLTGVTYRPSATGTPTKEITYMYDVFDRRIGKSVTVDATTDAERYVYDGDNIALVFDGNGDLKARYLYGPESDQVLAEEDGSGNVVWMLPDHQGTVRDLVNSSGTLINHVVYDSFGNIVSQTSGAPTPRFANTGREYDPETGLYYYRARYYDAGTGRFLSQDPIGFRSGDGNSYRYVFNSTPNLTDPSGLFSTSASATVYSGSSGGGGEYAARILLDVVDTAGNYLFGAARGGLNALLGRSKGYLASPNATMAEEIGAFQGYNSVIAYALYQFADGLDNLIRGTALATEPNPRQTLRGLGVLWAGVGAAQIRMAATSLALAAKAAAIAGQLTIGGFVLTSALCKGANNSDPGNQGSGNGDGGNKGPGNEGTGNKGTGNEGEGNGGNGKKLPDERIDSPPSKRGRPPTGDDGKPVELHHPNQDPKAPPDEMTRTDHRVGDNYTKNHENTGQEPSKIDRNDFAKQRRDYWQKEWDNGRFDDSNK